MASVSPTSLAGTSLASVLKLTPVRSVLVPPAVLTLISPALTALGTVRRTSCWVSGDVEEALSKIVRTSKLPTPRPSIWICSSGPTRPEPSSSMVLPVLIAPPTLRSVGTTCNSKLVVAPSTCTRPLRARAGTSSVKVRPSPLGLPVRVSVPAVPLSSTPANCTRVWEVKPWPCSTMAWPVLAAGLEGSAATPACAEAWMPVNCTSGCGANAGPASVALPPSVLIWIGPSRVSGAASR